MFRTVPTIVSLNFLFKQTVLLLVVLMGSLPLIGQSTADVIVIGESGTHPISKSFILVDRLGTLDEQGIIRATNFKSYIKDVPVFQTTDVNIWMKFSVVNITPNTTRFLDLQYSNISQLTLYQLEKGKLRKLKEGGNKKAFDQAHRNNPNFVFEVDMPKGDTITYYLLVNSHHPLLLPVVVQNQTSLDASQRFQTLITGIYLGILLAIFFYNLFLFISTLDKSYLIYVVFLFLVGLAQLTVSGYTFKCLWPGLPAFNRVALTTTSALAGISGIVFSMFFLHLKRFTPRWVKAFYVFIALYIASIVVSIAGENTFSYMMLNGIGIVAGLSLLVAAWYVAKQGYKPAWFYLVAWISFLLGVVIFSLRNLNLLPYNTFTTYVIYAGSAIEAIVLSIALADKINILRKEKEMSQAEALRISQENERLVTEQNIELERKVLERTEALSTANEQLTDAYSVLKDAQIQLVEAEKMASLGQLTAGIAHEINNPINFVKSNIKPLQLDIKDLFEVIDEYEKLHAADAVAIPAALQTISRLKNDIDMPFVRTEIGNLMKGIEDGADRTAEIVRGLRNFSRLDESQLKTVDIHEGIESTLIILRNSIPAYINVIRDFKADGEIDCFPGKLNQVFMNVLNNALQAIKAKTNNNVEEQIVISTRNIGEQEVEISIRDTGPGMTASIKHKVFDPFFTTKDVGEGTGLGLAIVFKIIQEHQGKIEVLSNEGDGASFVITLFRTIPMKPAI